MKTKSHVSAAFAGVLAALYAHQGVAQAQQPPKYGAGRGSKVKVEVEESDVTKSLEEKSAAKPKKKEEKVPEISADQFLDIQGKVKFIRKEQINEYKLLIQDTAQDDPELPELWFRLAELYSQQQRYWRFRAYELYETIDKAKSRSGKRKLKGKQKRYFKAEKAYLTAAIKAYAKIANNPNFKNYSKMDAVLFFYAYTLRNAKREDLARKVFHKLIKDYPKSKYIADAYLSFADYFFEKGVEDRQHLDTALKFYDKVLEVPQGKHLHAYAQYKKGWVYLNQDRPQDALETFYQVAQRTKNNKRQRVLNKASKKDFVRAYAEVGRAEKAYKAFQRVDRGYAFTMLKILAQLYLDQGKVNKTIYAHRELIGVRPKHKEVCQWQYNVVQAMLSVSEKSKKIEEITNLVRLYKKYENTGVLKGHHKQECEENARLITGELAKIWHNEAIKTLNDDILGYSEKLYKLYLGAFKSAEDHSEMEYYYAELLWTRAENEENQRLATEKWERAAVAFTDVVKSGKVKPKLRKESAYAAVLGWKNALAVDPRTEAKIRELDEDEKAEEVKPRAIKERQKKMIEAFDIYINYIKNPKDDELVMMKFLKARIYWRHDHLDKALPMFEDIIKKHTDHETARYSVNIVLDSYIRLKRYEDMNKYVVLLTENARYKTLVEDNDQLKERLFSIKAVARRKAAESLEEKGEYLECGLAYQEIYNDNPNADGMDEVLYNAGVCFEDAKSIGLAIQSFEKLSERFPKSSHTQKALVRMGNNYGAIAYYARAAEKYEEYAKKYGGEEDASKALSNAVVYRKGIGDDDQAIKDIEFFVKQYKRKLKQEAADALFGMTGIYEKRNQPEKVKKHLERYLREFGTRGGRDRVVIAQAKIGQILWEQSCRVPGVNDSCVNVSRERATRRARRRRRRGALPTQCGPASKIKLTVINRDRRRVNQARNHFRKAAQAFARVSPESIPGEKSEKQRRFAQAVYWYAAANFYLTEADYEEFLAVKFPTKLDFDPRNKRKAERSKKRFFSWLEKKKKMAEKAVKAYREVADIKGGGQAWRIAAAARVGQVFQNFADGLYTAEVPRDVRTGQYKEDKWDAYCDQLTTEAAPLEKESVSAFGFCLEKSTQLNWFNKWSKLCEKELGQIRPQDYPTASEVHALASGVAPITDTQGVIAELK